MHVSKLTFDFMKLSTTKSDVGCTFCRIVSAFGYIAATLMMRHSNDIIKSHVNGSAGCPSASCTQCIKVVL